MTVQTPKRTRTQVLAARPRPYDTLKRQIDLIAAACGLLLLLPLCLLIAISVYLDDPGPVFFRQKRVGRKGRLFTMLKFRTMRVETPDVSTEKMKALGVSYITRVGSILRKTSLDELPQLWNILKGEMSVVGPRPALYNQEQLIALREEAGIHFVRPGITGLAQVRGRDDLDDGRKVGYDEEYLERRSLRLDASILWNTFSAVLSARGNY